MRDLESQRVLVLGLGVSGRSAANFCAAQGARVVKYEDREVTYRSLDDMRSLRREIERELGLDTTAGRHFHRFQPTKGLE